MAAFFVFNPGRPRAAANTDRDTSLQPAILRKPG